MWIEQPTRRQMLQRMCAGFGMVGLAGMLPRIAAASGVGPVAHFAPRAKRVIFLFMNGGPSHVDTFDPKPRSEERRVGKECRSRVVPDIAKTQRVSRAID